MKSPFILEFIFQNSRMLVDGFIIAGESMYATFTFFLVFYVFNFRCIYHIEHISKTIILHVRKIMMKNSIYMNLAFSFYMYKLYVTITTKIHNKKG